MTFSLMFLAALASAAPARRPDPKSGEAYLAYQRGVMEAVSLAKDERNASEKERKSAEKSFERAKKEIERAKKAADPKAEEEARRALEEAAASRRKAEAAIARQDKRVGDLEACLPALARDPRIAAGGLLLRFSGEVRARRAAGAEWARLSDESSPVFEPGASFEAGKDGWLELSVPAAGVRVRIDPGAFYTLRELQKQSMVLATMLRGTARVVHQEPREARYAIQTPYAVVMGQEAQYSLVLDPRTGLETAVTGGTAIVADLQGRNSVYVPAGRKVKVSIRGEFGPLEPAEPLPDAPK